MKEGRGDVKQGRDAKCDSMPMPATGSAGMAQGWLAKESKGERGKLVGVVAALTAALFPEAQVLASARCRPARRLVCPMAPVPFRMAPVPFRMPHASPLASQLSQCVCARASGRVHVDAHVCVNTTWSTDGTGTTAGTNLLLQKHGGSERR